VIADSRHIDEKLDPDPHQSENFVPDPYRSDANGHCLEVIDPDPIRQRLFYYFTLTLSFCF
jgi:hypothetical protein